MAKQLYYEDVEVGMEIPSLVKHPTTRQLMQWGAASGDFYELHYDKDFAQSMDLPAVIVHGRLKLSLLGQMLTDWVGEEGMVRKLACQHRGMDFPGLPLTCKGKVSDKRVEDGEYLVHCNIWIENAEGENVAPGSAVLVLPSRDLKTLR